MGIVQKQGFINSIAIYLGILIGTLNNIFLIPWVFHDEMNVFGGVLLLYSLSNIISTFSSIGAPAIINKYYPHFEKNKGEFFFNVLILSCIGYSCLFLLYKLFEKFEIFGDVQWMSNLYAQDTIELFSLAAILVLFEYLVSISKVNLNSILPTTLKELVLRLLTSILILGYHYDFVTHLNIEWFYILQFLILLIIIAVGIRKKIAFSFRISIPLLKGLFKYGRYITLSGGMGVIITNIDFIMVGFLISESSLTYYSLFFFTGTLILSSSRAINTIVNPLIGKHWKDNDLISISELYKKSCFVLMVLGSFIWIIMNLNTATLFYLLPDKFAGGEWVILFISFSRVVDLLTGSSGAVILNSDFYKYEALNQITYILLIISLNWYFIVVRDTGVNGAAFATLLSTIIYNGMRVLLVYKKTKIIPYNKYFSVYFLSMIGAYFLLASLPNFHVFIDPIIDGMILLILTILLIRKLDKDQMFYSLLKPMFSKK